MMTSQQLAELQLQLATEQTHAAWVSAAASAAQAFGAIFAIGVSIKLATDAAKRERLAAIVAEAQAKATEKAADERVRAAELAEFNRPLQDVIGIGTAALTKIEADLAAARAQHNGFGGTIHGGYDNALLDRARKAVEEAGTRYADPQIQIGLMEAAGAFAPMVVKGRTLPELIKDYEALISVVNGGIERLRALKRT